MSADPAAAPGLETKGRILAAAELLFSTRGLAGTSVRAITAEAGVNVAAVHYHYGGRDELLRAVLERRIRPINERRLDLLDSVEAVSDSPAVEAVLEAFLRPALEALAADPVLGRVSGILFLEPLESAHEMARELFQDVFQRFASALDRALPHVPSAFVRQRLHFVVGAMIHQLHGSPLLGGEPALASPEEVLAPMIDFLAAGLRAPHGEPR